MFEDIFPYDLNQDYEHERQVDHERMAKLYHSKFNRIGLIEIKTYS